MPPAVSMSKASPAIRWVRRHLTTSALIDGLKTAAWVVPLTILIWIYAEQEQASSELGQPILVEVASSAPDKIITLLRPGDNVPTADLRGSKSRLDAVRSELKK